MDYPHAFDLVNKIIEDWENELDSMTAPDVGDFIDGWARAIASGNATLFFGACGNEFCTQCRPLFDAHNNEIAGT